MLSLGVIKEKYCVISVIMSKIMFVIWSFGKVGVKGQKKTGGRKGRERI